MFGSGQDPRIEEGCETAERTQKGRLRPRTPLLSGRGVRGTRIINKDTLILEEAQVSIARRRSIKGVRCYPTLFGFFSRLLELKSSAIAVSGNICISLPHSYVVPATVLGTRRVWLPTLGALQVDEAGLQDEQCAEDEGGPL